MKKIQHKNRLYKTNEAVEIKKQRMRARHTFIKSILNLKNQKNEK